MNGLKHILGRVIPIITLICFVSLGVLYIFNTDNLTYLNVEYMDKTTATIYTNPTEEQKEQSYKIYTYDFKTYVDNIDQNILERSIENTLDFQRYNSVLTNFNNIWENGYSFGKITETILNAVILTINTAILPINIIVTPIRIIAGLLLTGISLMGINTNANTPINNMLNGILDYAVIPLINPTKSYEQSPDQILGKSYVMNQNITDKYYKVQKHWISGAGTTSGWIYNYTNYNININFTSQAGGNYKQLFTQYTTTNGQENLKIWYVDTSNNQILVYNNGWLYEDSKHITISSNNDISNSDLADQLAKYINNNAELA